MLCSCEKKSAPCALPAKATIDSVIVAAIGQEKQFIQKIDWSTLDERTHNVLVPNNLCNTLLGWEIYKEESPNHLQKEESITYLQNDDTAFIPKCTFSYSWIKMAIKTLKIPISLTSNDSIFISQQIVSPTEYTFQIKSIPNISYLAPDDLKVAHRLIEKNIRLQFRVLQLNKPLFNCTQTLAFIGLNEVIVNRLHRDSTNYIAKSGLILLFEKRNKIWQFIYAFESYSTYPVLHSRGENEDEN